MWKLLLVAFVANFIYITSAADPEPICSANEFYSTCIQAECRPLDCTQKGQSVPCPRVPEDSCQKGCICKQGFLRDSNGNCIPQNQCNPPTCGTNELYSNCIQAECRPLNCTQKGQSVLCPKVPKDSCLKGCICKQAFLRDSSGNCIPENQCNKCKANQRYEECPYFYFLCKLELCSQLGYPQVPCRTPQPDEQCPMAPGCVCVDGYLKNSQGVCVKPDACPACGGDSNAQTGCGYDCNRHCSNYYKSPIQCPLACRYNACQCKSRFVYDDIVKKCVLPKDCTCGKYEAYSNCTNQCSGGRTCDEKGQIETCESMDDIECDEGCLCENGCLRNKKNMCIPQEQCPKIKCPKNEQYEQCPPLLCKIQNCSQLGFSQRPCNTDPNKKCSSGPGCICVDGYLRNDKGVCIKKEQCPSCGGDVNAKAGCGFDCSKHCDATQTACPAECPDNACECKPRFLYDDNTQKCVLLKNCSKKPITGTKM